jgi:protein-S-isoprenylcysteine O-methyltransferase Ste14
MLQMRVSMTAETAPQKTTLRLSLFSLLTALSLFLPAGTLRWWNAWAFMLIGVGLVGALISVVFRNDPDLVRERNVAASQAKGWDRVLVPLLTGVLPFASNITAGFDRRFGWTTALGLPHYLSAGMVMLVGMALTFRAMQTNPFFSSHVRIQHDRGHTVVSDGPYRFIRHPGYAGTILYNLAAPVMLGSLVALGIGIATTVLLVIRTVLEDSVLRRELSGYRDYATHVRFRLVPWLW